MREAREQDARLIHFSEGATCSPHKRIMSGDPGKVGQAVWDRFDWDVLRQELAETAELARTLRIWAGSAPITFEVDGMRFGCALGIECHFPEIFLEYERLGVDCILLSTHGPGIMVNNGPLALQAQAHAVSNSYWVSYAGTA